MPNVRLVKVNRSRRSYRTQVVAPLPGVMPLGPRVELVLVAFCLYDKANQLIEG